MSNPIPYSKTDDETDARSDRGSGAAYPGMPRWVKVAGIVVVALVLLVVIFMIVGGGAHSPGRHTPSASGASYAAVIAIDVWTHES
jgi:hypothetical protein